MIRYEPYQAKTILNKLKEIDEWFLCTYTLNPYRGCSHGCQYCYVQAEKYLPFDGKEDFFHRIQMKTNAPFLLQKELIKTKGGIILLGSSCDPYQGAEEKFKITRRLLEIILKFEFPLHIMTKSDLILRDLDLLKEINKKTFLTVSFSLITLNPKLLKIFEPNTPLPEKRLKALKKLTKSEIMAGIAVMPLIPYITNGEEFEKVVKISQKNLAKYVLAGTMTLRDRQKERFLDILKKNFSKLPDKYKKLYGKNIFPSFEYCEEIKRKTSIICEKYKIPNYIPIDDVKIPKKLKQAELW